MVELKESVGSFKFEGLLPIQVSLKVHSYCFIQHQTELQTMLKRLIFTLAVLLLTGCASVVNGSKQVIQVQTWCGDLPVKATCEAENGKGRHRFDTPAQVTVDRDVQGLRISCRDSRARTHVTWVSAVPDLAMAGNVLLGGLLGASVDVANGRGVAYPTHININGPTCQPAIKAATEVRQHLETR